MGVDVLPVELFGFPLDCLRLPAILFLGLSGVGGEGREHPILTLVDPLVKEEVRYLQVFSFVVEAPYGY
jgi:hypothetical protein